MKETYSNKYNIPGRETPFATEKEIKAESKRTKKATAETATKTKKKVDLSNNELYQIANDLSLSPHERTAKIKEKMELHLDSSEAAESCLERIKEAKQMVAELLSMFTAQNRASLELTRDNPLSALKQGIQEVFENYHAVATSRGELTRTLSIIDELLDEIGGEDKLIVAMLDAQTHKDNVDEIRVKIEGIDGEVADLNATIRSNTKEVDAENKTIRQLEGEWFSVYRPAVQTKRQEAVKRRKQAMLEQTEAEDKLSVAQESKVVLVEELDKLTNGDEYSLHTRILSILDIASPEFKALLSDVSNKTLNYVDNTELTLTQVRDQLQLLLNDIDAGLDVNVNIREQVAILNDAMQQVNKESAEKLQTFKTTSTAKSSIAQLENEKISRAGDRYVSEMTSASTSVTMIASEVSKLEVVLLSMRDQLNDGLVDADEQLLIAVNTASASGMIMMNKAQTLGTLAQAVVARGTYMAESEAAFGDLADEFARGLAVKAGRNDTLASMSSVIGDITKSLNETTDVAQEIATDRHTLVDNLNNGIQKLQAAAEHARDLDTRVNAELANSGK